MLWEGDSINRDDYLNANRKWLLGWYTRFDSMPVSISLPGKADFARQVEEILPEIPYIGGDDNPHTVEILNTAAWLVLWQLIKPQYSLMDLEALMEAAFQAGTKGLSKEQIAAATEHWFSTQRLEKVRMDALRSQERRYPEDWVFELNSGEPGTFEITYRECGICKFLARQRALNLAPLFCKGDFRTSALLDLGLLRTKTIANGDGICDFQYKLGRKN